MMWCEPGGATQDQVTDWHTVTDPHPHPHPHPHPNPNPNPHPNPNHQVAGLCSTTILSLPAHAALALAVQHATSRTRAYLGLRKL